MIIFVQFDCIHMYMGVLWRWGKKTDHKETERDEEKKLLNEVINQIETIS